MQVVVLESRNRRQLASTTSQRCRAVLMGLAIETTKTKESGREYESGYLCPRYFDSIKKYLALYDKLDSIRKDLNWGNQRSPSVCALDGIVCALNGIAQYLAIKGETTTTILPTRL